MYDLSIVWSKSHFAVGLLYKGQEIKFPAGLSGQELDDLIIKFWRGFYRGV